MFPEGASTLEIHLSREISREISRESSREVSSERSPDARVTIVAAPDGEWSARDAAGQRRHFSWRSRVRGAAAVPLDVRAFASYGADAQLERLQRALDDVADHVPEDGETLRLRADVSVSHNGRPPELVTLYSHLRLAR